MIQFRDFVVEKLQGRVEILRLRSTLRSNDHDARGQVFHPHPRHAFVAILPARTTALGVRDFQIFRRAHKTVFHVNHYILEKI